jgi:antitoxin component YwqK of YwqJK toxin-antitoxin module
MNKIFLIITFLISVSHYSVAQEIQCPPNTIQRGEKTPEVSETWCETQNSKGQTVLHGPYRAWYPNGTLGTKGQYHYGQATGFWEAWYENGQKEAEGYFDNGEEIGDWKYWDKKGNKISKKEHDLIKQEKGESTK